MTSLVPAVREAAEGEFTIDRREALRYLGCGNAPQGSLPSETLALLDVCEAELLAALRPRVCWARVPLSFPAPFTVDAGFGAVESVSLAKHLEVPFVQEVLSVSTALETIAPLTDVAIELGGEDAKIIYFSLAPAGSESVRACPAVA